jgi:hypothetical protein
MRALAAWVKRRANRRFHGAREVEHKGDGIVSFVDGTPDVMISEAAGFNVGPITILGSAEVPDKGYRAGRMLVGGTLIPATLAELTQSHSRREAFAHLLGVLALSLGGAPLVPALFAGLVA